MRLAEGCVQSASSQVQRRIGAKLSDDISKGRVNVEQSDNQIKIHVGGSRFFHERER